jgi:hypothetical protein
MTMVEKDQRDLSELGLPLLLTTTEVARAIHVDASTLSRWRAAGRGPRALWLGPGTPRYRREDVVAWLETAST